MDRCGQPISEPHLGSPGAAHAGKCVPFDWVAFCALLLAGRRKQLVHTQARELYVGDSDPSVLVLAQQGEGPGLRLGCEGGRYFAWRRPGPSTRSCMWLGMSTDAVH